MNAAEQAVKLAVHFEAKKTGLGQAQDGWSLTLRLQDHDLPPGIRDARKGTRYRVAMVEIGDDEMPVAVGTNAAPPDHKKRKPWHTMPASQRAALMCKDYAFIQWIRAADEDGAAIILRRRCGVHSRAHLDDDKEAQRRFLQLEEQFLIATGRVTPPDYQS